MIEKTLINSAGATIADRQNSITTGEGGRELMQVPTLLGNVPQ